MYLPIANQDPIISDKKRIERKIIRLTNELNAMLHNAEAGEIIDIHRINLYNARITTLKEKLERGDYDMSYL